MATIDDKVVAMSFESSKFESGVASTLGALDKLKAALTFNNAGKGLDEVSKAASRVNLGHIAQGVDNIQNKLSALNVAALAIFANIAQKAFATGTQLIKAFTLDPIKAGYAEYATNLNSIQTVLANTQAAGTNLKDVNAALQELNEYSDKTIYNFSQMAKNIGTFTAAGVDLETATGSIKGIANLAALSGSSADQASNAMYQLSQAISSGRVSLMDWNSVVNAGMGGTVFQRALAQTAVSMGTLKENSLKLVGPMKNVSISGRSFRESMQAAPGKQSWLTSDVLTKTLQQFTGDLTKAELKAQGFNDAQIKAIQQTAKTAKFAATEVKTLTQTLDVAKETAQSGWAKTWQIIFGDFGEAKKTFTELSNTINGFINANADARNKVLQDWKDLGGRTVLIDSIKTAFENLGAILKPIKQAFRDIFPATTGADLMYLTQRFERFAAALKPSPQTVENLRRTFRGLFAVLDIGKQIISGIFTVFGQLFGTLSNGSGGFLKFTANIGDWLVSLDKALKKGDRLHNFFVDLGKILAKPIELIQKLAGALADLFSGFSPGGISGELDGIGRALTPLEALVEGISSAWDKLVKSFGDAVDMQSILMSISEAIQGIGSAIGTAAANMNFEAILAVIRTGLFASLVLMFKQFLGRGSFFDQLNKGFGRGILSNISGIFDGLNGSMKSMQQNLKAKTLKEIAIAIALLAAALLMISLIKPERLNAALGAMTIMFAELIGAMALLDKIAKTGGFLKLPIIIAGLIGLAIAIDLLTLAVLALSRLSWDDLTKGLGGIGALLLIISKAIVPLSANSAGLIRAGFGITVIAVALNILALAVRQLGSMNLMDLGKGLIGITVGLSVMVTAMNKMPAKPVSVAGLIAMGVALNILALAVKQFSSMNMVELGKGLGGMAVGLGAMVVATRKMPPNMAVTAVQLLALAGAVWILADAIGRMGGMSMEQIGKGLGALAGSLVILSVALKHMEANVRGAAALAITATAIGLLTPALVMLGKQSWTSIVKGLVSLAGALAVMGVAGLALAPVAPSLLALGAAMFLIGAGIALVGAGLLAIAAGISALAVAGPTGIAIMYAALIEFYKTIPELAKNLVLGLLAIVDGIAKAAPQFVNALVKIINSLLNAIIQSAPKMADAFIALLDAGLKVLSERKEEIIQAGFELLIALLQGIKANIAQVTTMVVDIIVTFLRTLSTNLGRIVTAGANLLISLLKGIANNIGKVITAGYDIIIKFITSITSNLGRVLTAGISILTKLLTGIGTNIKDLVTAGGKAVAKFVEGIGEAGVTIVKAGARAAGKFITAIATEIPKLAQDVFDALILLINGMATVIGSEQNMGKLRDAAKNLGFAIINGMTLGLAGKARDLYNKAEEIMGNVLGIFKKIPFINSPSKATAEIGASLVEGLVLGLDRTAVNAYASATALSNGVIGAFNTAFQTNSPSKVMMEIGQYVGQGFAIGLRGSTDDINNAFRELNDKLTKTMTTARETIASEQEKLDKLRAAKKPDTAAIKKAQDIIDQNEDLLRKSTETRKALTVTLKDEHRQLTKLTTEYEKMGERIKTAKEELKRIQDFVQTIQSQYSDTPDLSGPMTQEITDARRSIAEAQAELNRVQSEDSTAEQIASAQENLKRAQESFNTLVDGKILDDTGNSVNILATYLESLKNQSTAVEAYNSTLEQLRKLGLDETTYRKLLEEGTADQAFATQLLAGGRTAVQGLNKLDKQLKTVSGTLATNAAENLEHGGVQAAKGLLKGLTSQNQAIKNAMDNIVEEIITTIKRKMQIKSPSKVFEEIGSYAMLGLAEGFSKSSKIVTDAVENAANDALTSMKNSMRKITDLVTDGLDTNPVITPILDLTQVQNQSRALSALTNVTPITAAASYGQASIISSQQNVAQMEEMSKALTGPTVKFEQNNYSPESLSEIEIYRQTKNQLSQLKSVLATT